MKTLRAWWSRLIGFVSPGTRERDFADELQSHLDLHIDHNLRAGMLPAEARRAALIKLGSITSVTESHRDRRASIRSRPCFVINNSRN